MTLQTKMTFERAEDLVNKYVGMIGDDVTVTQVSMLYSEDCANADYNQAHAFKTLLSALVTGDSIREIYKSFRGYKGKSAIHDFILSQVMGKSIEEGIQDGECTIESG